MTDMPAVYHRPDPLIYVAVDFDGVICVPKWADIGPPMKGVGEFLRFLSRPEIGRVLWTCRYGDKLAAAIAWMNINLPGYAGSFWHAVNENPQRLRELYGNDPRKVGVDLYIDDKAVGFPMDENGEVQWDVIRRAIEVKLEKARQWHQARAEGGK